MSGNALEIMGAIAAVIMGGLLIWEIGYQKKYGDVGQLYVVENGKWMPVTRHENKR